jgi:hypothetical protein
MRAVCQNKWCKAPFEKSEQDEKKICPKCISMANELSGGVEWVDKTYEGPRFDGLPHQLQIKVNRNYK